MVLSRPQEERRYLFQGLFESFLKQRQVEITRFRPVSCPHCRERQTREAVMARLRKAGIQVILDDWHNAEIGSDVQRFIDRIAKSDSIIVIR